MPGTPRTPGAVLADLGPLLVRAYEHPDALPSPPTQDGLPSPFAKPVPDGLSGARLDQAIRHRLDEAFRLGITARQIAAHARVPGRWLITNWVPTPEARAEAYRGEIHHLERAVADIRAIRAVDVYRLTETMERGDAKPLKKVAVAAMHGVSRPALDKWIAAGRRDIRGWPPRSGGQASPSDAGGGR